MSIGTAEYEEWAVETVGQLADAAERFLQGEGTRAGLTAALDVAEALAQESDRTERRDLA